MPPEDDVVFLSSVLMDILAHHMPSECSKICMTRTTTHLSRRANRHATKPAIGLRGSATLQLSTLGSELLYLAYPACTVLFLRSYFNTRPPLFFRQTF